MELCTPGARELGYCFALGQATAELYTQTVGRLQTVGRYCAAALPEFALLREAKETVRPTANDTMIKTTPPTGGWNPKDAPPQDATPKTK